MPVRVGFTSYNGILTAETKKWLSNFVIL